MMKTRRKIRLLHVVDGFRMGGAENKLAELIERLDRQTFDQYLANVGPDGPLYERFKSTGVPIYQCQRRNRFDIKPILKLKKLMHEKQIDIVQTTLFWADFSGILAAKLARVPVVLSWETVTHEGDPYHYKLQRKIGYKLAMKFASGIIAVSHEIKDSLIRRRGIPPDMIHVIHYGVDLNTFSLNGNPGKKREELGFSHDQIVIGIVARLEAVKGHKYFIEAFHQLAPKYRQMYAVLIGDGSQKENLKKLVDKYQLQDRVRFLGIRRDIPELLHAIDIFVLPSIAGEGLPNVILEAMACGKPIVATRVGGTPEAVLDGENGYVVPAGDPAALASALQDLLDDAEKRKQFGLRSRQLVEEHFSLQKQLSSFEALYVEMYQKSIN